MQNNILQVQFKTFNQNIVFIALSYIRLEFQVRIQLSVQNTRP